MKLRSLLVKPWTIIFYIGCIILISIAGAHHLYSQIQLLKKDIPEIVTAKRNVAAEAQYMVGLLREYVEDSTFTRILNGAAQPERWAIEAKIRHGLEIVSASSIKLKTLNERLTSDLTDKASRLLDEVGLAGQGTLSARGEARKAKAKAFLQKLDAERGLLGEYIAHFTQEQLRTSKQQKALLESTTQGAAFLLGVFVFFASIAGILLRLEVAAQKRRSDAEANAAFLASHDPLTELPNRSLFGKTASGICLRTQPCLLFLLNLDEFRAVNSAFGHVVGDRLLKVTAQRIEGFVKARDGYTARLSGDEFAALIPGGKSGVPIETISRELREIITEPVEADGLRLVTQVSIGVVQKRYGEHELLSDLLSKADLALREAKLRGRGRYVIYHQKLAEKARKRREIKEALPAALEKGEIELHFQPQIQLDTGRLSGFEALVRWRRNDVLISPAEFIPVLEEAGIIRLLDLWVLGRATKTAARWAEMFGRPVSISVNLSPLNFQFDDIVAHVREALSESKLPPHLLTLEITESVVLNNWERVTRILTSLSHLGANVSLDDFGTGYSSLAYLRDLKFDELKIDRGFLSDIEKTNENMIVLNSLVEIARGLGLNIVAEGIETLAQRDVLRKMGVHTGQGYLFGRPVDEAHAASILERETGGTVDWNRKAESADLRSSAQVA
jgi:diguanylate cyclase (GGDEF)-like protein